MAVFAALWPTPTFPNDKEDGLTAKVPAATALPETATVMVPAVAALVEMMSLPAGFPAVRGVKATVRAALWPGARLKGIAGAVTWKEGSEDTALAIVTVVEVRFVRVSVSCLETPTTAVPKSRFALAAATEPLLVGEDAAPGTAWHPAMRAMAKTTKKAAA